MTIYGCPPWLVMWSASVLIFGICKLMTLRGVAATVIRKLAYCFAWPGMDAKAFCGPQSAKKPASGEFIFALAKTFLGCCLLWGISPNLETPLVRGWVGMIGLIFTLHFGLFHMLSWSWRRTGFVAKPLMDWPIKSTSLADFWGRRWNTAFRDLTHRFLFRPLTARLGAKLALAVGFLVSGIIHDVVISVPAGGGYGLPTLYFVLQGLGLLIERAVPKLRGRLFTFAILVLPAYWLFHPDFVLKVIIPFLDWLQTPNFMLRNP